MNGNSGSSQNAVPLPIRLYRFRTFGGSVTTGHDKNTVFELLKGRIRFARLQDFNDPFEGRPFPVPAFADAGKQRAAMLKYIYDLQRSTGLSPRAARMKAEDFLAGKTQAEIVEWVGERLLETNSRDGLFVCCLSGPEAVATPLAWSHYADHHRGVAIHFDTQHPPFKFAFPVIYSESYPESIVPRSHQNTWEHVQRSFFTKCSLWSYEHEFRVLKVEWPAPGRDPRAVTLFVEWDGATAIASPDAVIGVTIGARMGKTDRDELIAEINAEFPRLEIWQSKLHRSRYEIISERVA